MLNALLTDLASIGTHQIVTTADRRFPVVTLPGVEVVTLPSGRTRNAAVLDALMASADAVWLVAPETGRCLERLASRAERNGSVLLGSSAAVIRRAADKAALQQRLVRHGVPCPETRLLRRGPAWNVQLRRAARELGFPVVIKPRLGAGCSGVCLVRHAREIDHAVAVARRANPKAALLMQRYVPGVAASVSLLADGRRAVALTVNAQSVRASLPFSYQGGRTPLQHPLSARAIETALRTCRALPGLRGFVGIDLVLTRSEAVVIEVNPRITTAYLGVRSALEGHTENVAAMTLAACAGTLPAPPPVRRRVRFTAAGRVVAGLPLSAKSAESAVWGTPIDLQG
jgi:predicted ATP-grasp superfamily ATP-dependent carboligase